MSDPGASALLATRLREEADVLGRWMDSLRRRAWMVSGPDHAAAMEVVEQRCGHFLAALRQALDCEPATLETGAPEFREAIQSLSFTAGWMAGAGLPVADALALVNALQDVVELSSERFYHSLLVVVCEAFAASLEQRAHARHRDAVEKSQVVCELHAALPALFLVGDPDRRAVDDAVGRVMMLAAMRQAPVVIVDGSGLLSAEQSMHEACPILVDHGQAASVSVLLTGIAPALAAGLPLSEGVTYVETLPAAIARACRAAGISWD